MEGGQGWADNVGRCVMAMCGRDRCGAVQDSITEDGISRERGRGRGSEGEEGDYHRSQIGAPC